MLPKYDLFATDDMKAFGGKIECRCLVAIITGLDYDDNGGSIMKANNLLR